MVAILKHKRTPDEMEDGRGRESERKLEEIQNEQHKPNSFTRTRLFRLLDILLLITNILYLLWH